jgi:hypothetical protein
MADGCSEGEIAQELIDISRGLLAEYRSIEYKDDDGNSFGGTGGAGAPVCDVGAAGSASEEERKGTESAGEEDKNRQFHDGDEEDEDEEAAEEEEDADDLDSSNFNTTEGNLSIIRSKTLSALKRDMRRSRNNATSSVWSQDSVQNWSPPRKYGGGGVGVSSSPVRRQPQKHQHPEVDAAGSPVRTFSTVKQFAPFSASKDYASHFSQDSLELKDLIVEKMHIHYGQKHRNPVDNMRFFPKEAPSDW